MQSDNIMTRFMFLIYEGYILCLFLSVELIVLFIGTSCYCMSYRMNVPIYN